MRDEHEAPTVALERDRRRADRAQRALGGHAMRERAARDRDARNRLAPAGAHEDADDEARGEHEDDDDALHRAPPTVPRNCMPGRTWMAVASSASFTRTTLLGSVSRASTSAVT